MSVSTFFVQACPVCGRHLEVRIRSLGKTVSCIHCGGHFVAQKENAADGIPVSRSTPSSLLSRADQLLNRFV